ncbi:SCO2522 family protein [Actinosynnema sp. NPDC020468]|uniref:SCO2522 family protein n=1 Tax=Actinosynnema sp. NPDC020468 TaxID=3154488 RepID=UPI0033F36537
MSASGYSERVAERRVAQVPLAHLSVEVGRLGVAEILADEGAARALFRRVAPWSDAVRASLAAERPDLRPRLSTCFLIDDYHCPDSRPQEVLDRLLSAAGEFDVRIDYLTREAGCHEADGVPLAEVVAAMLVPEPPVGTNGSRPPTHDTGWLCNGERSTPDRAGQAMTPAHRWSPPVEFGRRGHSVFLDVELWRDDPSSRRWSAAFLAAVAQLTRLGVLRHEGDPVAVPRAWPDTWPARWEDLPAVVRLRADASPYTAYRTASILPASRVGVEHAVDVILDHLVPEEEVAGLVVERARAEGVALPDRLRDRHTRVFVDGTPW